MNVNILHIILWIQIILRERAEDRNLVFLERMLTNIIRELFKA